MENIYFEIILGNMLVLVLKFTDLIKTGPMQESGSGTLHLSLSFNVKMNAALSILPLNFGSYNRRYCYRCLRMHICFIPTVE